MKTDPSIAGSLRAKPRFALITIICVSIAACGGGSDNAPPPPPPPPANVSPTTNAGADQTVEEGTGVALTGIATDSDGSIASTTWAQTAGASVTLSATNTLSTQFTAPAVSAPTVFEFSLTVLDNQGASASDVVRINVNPAVWQTGAALTSARWGLRACSLNGKIYVFGGADHDTLVQEFDIATQLWSTKASLAVGRRYGSACAVVNGRIYVLGGYSSAFSELNTVEVYDPSANTWATRAAMPTARHNLTASVVNGKIYAIGGRTNAVNALSAVEEYDPVSDAWTARAGLPLPHHSPVSEAVGGKLYVFGGYSIVISGGYSDASYEYDPATNAWRALASMPTARFGHSSAALNGKVYVIGGADGVTGPNTGIAVVEQYDPATDDWTPRTDMPTGREYHASTVIGNAIHVLGGRTTSAYDSRLDSVEIYNPAQDD